MPLKLLLTITKTLLLSSCAVWAVLLVRYSFVYKEIQAIRGGCEHGYTQNLHAVLVVGLKHNFLFVGKYELV